MNGSPAELTGADPAAATESTWIDGIRRSLRVGALGLALVAGAWGTLWWNEDQQVTRHGPLALIEQSLTSADPETIDPEQDGLPLYLQAVLPPAEAGLPARFGAYRLSPAVSAALAPLQGQPVSLIARQRAESNGSRVLEPVTLRPAQTRPQAQLVLAAAGTIPAAILIADARQPTAPYTWPLRLAGFALLALGIRLLLEPMVAVFAVVPSTRHLLRSGLNLIAASLALPITTVTIATAWVGIRPALALELAGSGIATAIILLTLKLYPRHRP